MTPQGLHKGSGAQGIGFIPRRGSMAIRELHPFIPFTLFIHIYFLWNGSPFTNFSRCIFSLYQVSWLLWLLCTPWHQDRFFFLLCVSSLVPVTCHSPGAPTSDYPPTSFIVFFLHAQPLNVGVLWGTYSILYHITSLSPKMSSSMTMQIMPMFCDIPVLVSFKDSFPAHLSSWLHFFLHTISRHAELRNGSFAKTYTE